MLSGGERALTAVALLFAMLEVRPVPFCVLDEVDAALDEANVGRFVEALRGLAETTQFIVITHNRGTIEAADALYGVTVGEDAVSRVVSLRIEEARSIAAQRARRSRGDLARPAPRRLIDHGRRDSEDACSGDASRRRSPTRTRPRRSSTKGNRTRRSTTNRSRTPRSRRSWRPSWPPPTRP